MNLDWLTWEFALTILGALVTGILGNLLTPVVKVAWARFRAIQAEGYQSQIRQQLKVVQNNLDQHNRLTASGHELFLYLFRWLLAIFAVFILACACAFIGATAELTDEARKQLLSAALICLIGAVVMCAVILWSCRDYTIVGEKKKRASLEAQIDNLSAKLSQSANK